MTALLTSLLKTAVPSFAVCSMLSVGLSYTVQQIVGPLHNVRGVIRALVANFALVPLLAFAVMHIFPLNRSLQIGLLLLATAAGAPFLIKLTQAAEGNTALSATLLVLLMPATVAVMPAVVPLAAPEADVSASRIAAPLLLTMLLPLGIGLFVNARFPYWAARLQPLTGKVSTLALIVLLVTTFIVNLRPFLALFGTGAILAALFLIGGAFVIGYLLGGPDSGSRSVLGLGTAQRNIAAATVAATEGLDNPDALVMVVVSSLVSLLILFPIAWALRRHAAREARAVAKRLR